MTNGIRPDKTARDPGKPGATSGIGLPILIGLVLTAGFVFSTIHIPLARATALAKRAMCAANLRALAVIVEIYKAEHDNRAPLSWDSLTEDPNFDPKLLVCPSSGAEPSPTTRPADLAAHCDYVLVSGVGAPKAPRDAILAFELPTNHGQAAVNAAFATTEVLSMKDMNDFAARLQQTNEYLAQQRRKQR